MFEHLPSIRDVIESYRAAVPDLGMFFLLDVWAGLMNAFGMFLFGVNFNVVPY